ncbi:hypothetical protein QFZ42_005371 [Variovorax paradoxus]|uniref:hypothetical protein n=1 Tax=Variovorax paradoxus TaxID=34073 RepID=UPI002790CA3D|nr:hypothetical protein [Variovorax paradoxus]MDQ0573537.1 hypothetical protein [Variovorax paradoxus]
MLRSFKQLAAEPGAPLMSQPANARDVVAWLQQAQVKLQDARQTAVSPGTRMDAAWDAVLLSSLAVACAEGWRVTSDRGHHVVAFEGAACAVGLGQARFDALDALRDWRNRKYRAGFVSTVDEANEAVALAEPYLTDAAAWFAATHAALMKRGLAP